MELQCLKTANEENYDDVLLTTAVIRAEDVDRLSLCLYIPEQLELKSTDSNLVYYVAGCLGRSVGRVRKCEDCHSLLLLPKDNCECDIEVVPHCSEYTNLLEEINRGGLRRPTEYCFAVCCVIFICYKQIVDNFKLHRKFICKCEQRNLFYLPKSALKYQLRC